MFYLFLPDEFVLKKCIVALVIALNILLCKFIEACIQTDTNVAYLITVAIIIKKVKTIKTLIQFFREVDHQLNVFNEFSVADICEKMCSSKFILKLL